MVANIDAISPTMALSSVMAKIMIVMASSMKVLRMKQIPSMSSMTMPIVMASMGELRVQFSYPRKAMTIMMAR